MSGLVLALDAGSSLVSVAAGRHGTVLAARHLPLARSSTQLLSLVDEVLAAAGARAADLDGIVALAGPGSFTGLRVGLATALGLHQALGVRALALPTLLAMAAACAAPPGALVIAAVDALRGEWSAQAFRAGDPPAAWSAMTLVPAAGVPRLAEERADALDGAGAEGAEASRASRAPSSAPLYVIAHGAASLHTAAGGAAAGAVFVEAPPLAATALHLAAAVPAELWQATRLAVPIYARPPATTAPRRRPLPEPAETAEPAEPAARQASSVAAGTGRAADAGVPPERR